MPAKFNRKPLAIIGKKKTRFDNTTMLRKNNHIIIWTTLLLFIATYSCSKNPRCWGDNKEKGIIENSVIVKCEPAASQDNYIINDDSTFQQLFTSNTTPICEVPVIDFTNYTLLGLFTTGGCETKYIREVTKIENENKYHYKVTVKSCGYCKVESYSYNWVTVPKLPNGWTVTFEVKNK